ncbi:MAG: hypothetical protein IPG91_14280 [Ideonella sp.]|nr:hypothetical protein [Ideonella sp.]
MPLPDMYDYGAVNREGDGVKSAGIGSYCLMGSGNHLDSGRTPAPVCAYLRDLVGWCNTEIALNRHRGEGRARRLRHRAQVRHQHAQRVLPVENRAKIGLDRHPSSGLAIYHCDTLGSNEFQQGTGQRHYQCALLQGRRTRRPRAQPQPGRWRRSVLGGGRGCGL